MIKPQNILIVRTDRIGDVILTLPMADVIKKHYPDAEITFMLRDYTLPLAENNDCIDKTISLIEEDGKIPFFKNLKKISGGNFDTCIVVNPSFQVALMLFLSGIKLRVGTGYRWYSLLFNKKVYEHRKYGKTHELELNVNLLKQLNIFEHIDKENVKFNIHIDEEADKKVDEYLSSLNIDKAKSMFIVHPGSGGSAMDLPIKQYKKLIQWINENLNVNVLLTGSEQEKNICEELRLNENIFNTAGEFNLKELTALINKSDLFISNSTGPLHIAAALDVHTIGFYPKIAACSPNRWGPYSLKSKVFTPEIECANCTREQCERLDCMSNINIKSVFEYTEKIYKFIINNGENNA